jgi:hypothetical protein
MDAGYDVGESAQDPAELPKEPAEAQDDRRGLRLGEDGGAAEAAGDLSRRRLVDVGTAATGIGR